MLELLASLGAERTGCSPDKVRVGEPEGRFSVRLRGGTLPTLRTRRGQSETPVSVSGGPDVRYRGKVSAGQPSDMRYEPWHMHLAGWPFVYLAPLRVPGELFGSRRCTALGRFWPCSESRGRRGISRREWRLRRSSGPAGRTATVRPRLRDGVGDDTAGEADRASRTREPWGGRVRTFHRGRCAEWRG